MRHYERMWTGRVALLERGFSLRERGPSLSDMAVAVVGLLGGLVLLAAAADTPVPAPAPSAAAAPPVESAAPSPAAAPSEDAQQAAKPTARLTKVRRHARPAGRRETDAASDALRAEQIERLKAKAPTTN